jgi:hypothetical protein
MKYGVVFFPHRLFDPRRRNGAGEIVGRTNPGPTD